MISKILPVAGMLLLVVGCGGTRGTPMQVAPSSVANCTGWPAAPTQLVDGGGSDDEAIAWGLAAATATPDASLLDRYRNCLTRMRTGTQADETGRPVAETVRKSEGRR